MTVNWWVGVTHCACNGTKITISVGNLRTSQNQSCNSKDWGQFYKHQIMAFNSTTRENWASLKGRNYAPITSPV